MKKILTIGAILGMASLANAAVTIADLAGDYVDATSAPAGWMYLFSNTNSGGTEGALAPSAAIGNAGNIGFGRDAAVTAPASGNTFNAPAILGKATSGDLVANYQIFADGYAGNGTTIPGHHAAAGTDLLLTPGNSAAFGYVIARYTLSAADILNGTSATISGSFRDLCGGTTGGGAGSIEASIWLNTTSLFLVNGAAGRLWQTNGTFNLTDITVAAGDTISFAVGWNGSYGGDETALSGVILVPEPGSAALLLGGLGLLLLRRWRA